MSKLTIKLSFGDDLRRVTIDPATFTFAQLKATIARLYTSLAPSEVDRLVIKYLDDEEDLVTITTNEELIEAFNLSRAQNPPVLRLHLNQAPKTEEKSEESHHHPHPHPHPFWFHHGHSGPRRPRGPGHPGWARRHAGRRCPAFPDQPAVDLKDLPQTRKDDRHPHELVLNSTPYGNGHFICDGCHLAGEGASYHCAQCQFDLHLDCQKARASANPWQRRQQWFHLHQEAMKAMELKTREGLEKARELFKEQIATSPFHRVTPLYNLACVEALLGDNLEKALEYLREAIAAGWTDVQHILNDSDLTALRELEGFKALIASLEGDSSDDETIVEINIGGLDKELCKKLKAEWKQQCRELKREWKREMKLEDRIERLQARAQQFQTLAEKLRAKYQALQEKVAQEKKPEAKPEEKPEEKKTEPLAPAPAPVPQPAPSPAPTPNLAPSPVQMPGSSAIEDFQGKLRNLEEMGFSDRRRNITALVLARGDLVAALQSLLSDQ